MDSLATNWWAIGIRGALAIAFGLLAIVLPGLTLLVLATLFGIYAVAEGVFAVLSGVRSDAGGDRHWLLILGGIVSIAAGLVAIVWPGISALALLYVIGAWAVVTGMLEVYAAFRLRSVVRHELILAFEGAVSILFGLLVMAVPGAGALAVVWLIGVYAIVIGVSFVLLAFRLRGHLENIQAPV